MGNLTIDRLWKEPLFPRNSRDVLPRHRRVTIDYLKRRIFDYKPLVETPSEIWQAPDGSAWLTDDSQPWET